MEKRFEKQKKKQAKQEEQKRMEIGRERQQRGVSVHELHEHKARVEQYKRARYNRKE